jgi:hypothetical protein
MFLDDEGTEDGMIDRKAAQQRPREDFYSEEELKRRGWTGSRIEDLLGECDVRGVNPHHKVGPLLLFYLKERVHRAEQTGEASGRNDASNRFVLTSDQMSALLDSTISVFMEYQFRHGYEEPRARHAAIQTILDRLESVGRNGARTDEV